MQYEFMVPVYHEVATEIPVETVSLQGAIILILLAALVLFKFRFSAPKKGDAKDRPTRREAIR